MLDVNLDVKILTFPSWPTVQVDIIKLFYLLKRVIAKLILVVVLEAYSSNINCLLVITRFLAQISY
jgi:hypothetical protein